MNGRHYCPECDTLDTEQVFTDFHTDVVKEVRICNSCEIQYTNTYTLEIKEKDEI